MTEIAEIIEDGTRALVEEDGLQSGVGFPTGLSLNEVAAHYSPNANDKLGKLFLLCPLFIAYLSFLSAQGWGYYESGLWCPR
jgi:hypothetical protein